MIESQVAREFWRAEEVPRVCCNANRKGDNEQERGRHLNERQIDGVTGMYQSVARPDDLGLR